jgi:hypothetical protein
MRSLHNRMEKILRLLDQVAVIHHLWSRTAMAAPIWFASWICRATDSVSLPGIAEAPVVRLGRACLSLQV